MEEKIKELLAKVKFEYEEAIQQQKEMINRGEYIDESQKQDFGHIEQNHSNFIAYLLNPKETHGMGDKLLKAFLKQVGIDEYYIDASKCNTKDMIERFISNLNPDKTEGGKIDIIVEDGSHAVIIENKIYAPDQEKQLQRYSEYAYPKFKGNYKLIYLTLFGDMPREDVGDLKNIMRKSYERDIIEWLSWCVIIVSDKQSLKKEIQKYLNLVKYLTHQTLKDNYLKKVAEIAIEAEEIDNIIKEPIINEAESYICKLFRERYVYDKIEEYAKSEFFNVNRDSKSIRISKPGWKGRIQIKTENIKGKWEGMFIGITYGEEMDVKEKLNCFSCKPNIDWPYGFQNIRDSYDWDTLSSCMTIKKPEAAKCIIDLVKEILTEIEEKKIPM